MAELAIEKELGDVIIRSPDGHETHVYQPPEGEFFDNSGAFRRELLEKITAGLGSPTNTRKAEREEKTAHGDYRVERVACSGPGYNLVVTNDELYFGASGGTEQILLHILSGTVGGIAGSLTTWAIHRIGAGFSRKDASTWSAEERLRRLEAILKKRFGAVGPLQFSRLNSKQGKQEFIAGDSKGTEFRGELTEDEHGVLSVDVFPRQRQSK